MRKTMMQAVFVCVVLAVTRDVANAIFYITIPNNEVEVTDVITQASYGWSTTERLNVGSGNAFNGPGTWDGVLTVHSNGTVTVGTIFMINGGPKTNGKIIVDGTNSTMTAELVTKPPTVSMPG